MDPTIWGPKLWFMIHTIALNYPDNPTYQDRRSYEEFYNSLKFVIPCEKCRIHYTQRLKRMPIINHLDNSNTLFKYTVDLHNQVNKSLNKKIYSYQEVMEIYKNHYNKSSLSKKYFTLKNVLLGVGSIFIISALVIYLKKKYPRRLIKC